MATSILDALEIIHHHYGSDASNVWSDRPSSATVVYRCMQIHGVGQKIATMAAHLLARDFKIKFKDYYSVDLSVDIHITRVFQRLG